MTSSNPTLSASTLGVRMQSNADKEQNQAIRKFRVRVRPRLEIAQHRLTVDRSHRPQPLTARPPPPDAPRPSARDRHGAARAYPIRLHGHAAWLPRTRFARWSAKFTSFFSMRGLWLRVGSPFSARRHPAHRGPEPPHGAGPRRLAGSGSGGLGWVGGAGVDG